MTSSFSFVPSDSTSYIPKHILTTERLQVRELDATIDPPFIYTLLNTDTWLKHIGQRNINNLEDAKNYIINGPQKSYQEHGFGLWLIQLKQQTNEQNDSNAAIDTYISIGIAGILSRPGIVNPDIGYALLPEYTGQGYAEECCKAIMSYGHEALKISKIIGITSESNPRSQKLLEKIGMKHTNMIEMNNIQYMLFE